MERNQGPMKHQMERMWDSKNDAAADANITRSLSHFAFEKPVWPV